MEDYEATVEQMDDVAVDDALPEDVVEESDESVSIESVLDEDAAPAEEPQETGKQGTSEPGWIKKRVQSAVDKAVRETEARMQAMFEQQMAPIREQMLEAEAEKLVRQGIVKDLETGKELARYRMGQSQPTQADTKSQPRNEQGQFAPKEAPKEDPATSARIGMLQHQADKIRAAGGPDVIAEFRDNPEIKQAIISGEMDFYDVAEQMKAQPRRKPPAPMRAPNGASGSDKTTVASMSDEQFERFERKVSEGTRFQV